MEDPRPLVFSILEDVTPCPDRAFVYSVSSLQNAWTHEAPDGWALWWIDRFIRDPDIARRMKGGYLEIGRVFADLERLHLATYGTPTRIPPAIVAAVRRRVLAGWFPVAYETLDYAEGAATETVARNLKRFIGGEQWRKEF